MSFTCPQPDCPATTADLLSLPIRPDFYTAQEFAPTYKCSEGHWSRATLNGPRRIVSPVLQTFTAPLELDDIHIVDPTPTAENERACVLAMLALRIAGAGCAAHGRTAEATVLTELPPISPAVAPNVASLLAELRQRDIGLAATILVRAAGNAVDALCDGDLLAVARAAVHCVQQGKASNDYPIPVEALVRAALPKTLG